MSVQRRYRWSFIWAFYIGFIFYNSMTPAVESSAQSGFVLEQVLRLLDAVGLEQVQMTEYIIRKTAHVLEYALMGMLLYQCLSQYTLSVRERLGGQILVSVLIPLVDETIQLFTTGRSGQISDVWLDFTGAIGGAVLLYLLMRSWARKEEGNPIEEKL